MRSRFVRIDLHTVVTPSGATVIEPQFVSTPAQATQDVLQIGTRPALREGDRFRCEHCPKAGPFKNPLPAGTGEGSVSKPGQTILKVEGVLVATLAGTNSSCSEGVQEMPNRATVALGDRPIVFVEEQPVLVG